MRVERTGDGQTRRPPVLKTGRITGPHALPCCVLNRSGYQIPEITYGSHGTTPPSAERYHCGWLRNQSVLNPHLGQDKRIIKCRLFQAVVSSRGAAMPGGIEVCFED